MNSINAGHKSKTIKCHQLGRQMNRIVHEYLKARLELFSNWVRARVLSSCNKRAELNTLKKKFGHVYVGPGPLNTSNQAHEMNDINTPYFCVDLDESTKVQM